MSSLLVNQLYAGGTDSNNTALLTGTQLTLNLNSSSATSLSQTTLTLYNEAGSTTVAANELSMTSASNAVRLNNSVPSVYVTSSETVRATLSDTGLDIVSGASTASLSATGLTFVGNSTITLGATAGTENQVLTSGGATGSLSWQTMSAAASNVYYYFEDVNAASGTVAFSAFSNGSNALSASFSNMPVITLTAITGSDDQVCVPVSINSIDLTANEFTWSSSSTIASLCATLISRG